ncbi:hypothetical protein BS50DRAFT_341665 [Corynespora cassiicola Philippines]|uniref:Uncharacterized protein n=1 Tax=Corynespora cassiicola Philippines TaxID=1448308 RepID=A0A2T2NVK1_CORCC|nr:hypothetical protein BS50DRAFT_341665 [Corynespora cassiicola Philippines]
MALRRQSLSPASNLLRNSRLFAIPNPLPRPAVGETSGSGSQKGSDSATTPYPTHQAITTTKSSLARGDWGLKRAIPARSRIVQTSNPVLRINQLDTIEHITDYDSAADHVRTREKFEELGIPMMRDLEFTHGTGMTATKPKSAFEERADTTAYDSDKSLDDAGLFLEAIKESSRNNIKKAKKGKGKAQFTPFTPPAPDAAPRDNRRWKHEGPWLPGMSADEFSDYVSRELLKRRGEFNGYLREYVKGEIYAQRKVAARKASAQSEEGMPLDAAEAEALNAKQEAEWSAISKEDIANGIRVLRREAALDPWHSNLVKKLIIPFLRLPPMKLQDVTYNQSASEYVVNQKRFTGDTTPLSTHPSAGLGYLRTNAHLANHPILGPQAKHTPVPARVVQPIETSTNKADYARLGVAGFVANDEWRAAASRTQNSRSDVYNIDIHTPGGRKVPVHPQYAAVSNSGRIHLRLTRAVGAEVAVSRGELEDKPPAREFSSRDPLADLGGVGAAAPAAAGEDSAQAKDLQRLVEKLAKRREQKERKGEVPASEPFRPGQGFEGVGEAVGR